VVFVRGKKGGSPFAHSLSKDKGKDAIPLRIAKKKKNKGRSRPLVLVTQEEGPSTSIPFWFREGERNCPKAPNPLSRRSGPW